MNKGTDHLVPAITAAGLDWPLVVAGDGPDRPAIEAAARAANRDVRFLGWLDPEAVAGWIAHAAMLIFPSRGPESLSRVLIEASALGVPIAAMHTGGTADIVQDEITGLLSKTRRSWPMTSAGCARIRNCARGSGRRRRGMRSAPSMPRRS